jgi:hypothetical protein
MANMTMSGANDYYQTVKRAKYKRRVLTERLWLMVLHFSLRSVPVWYQRCTVAAELGDADPGRRRSKTVYQLPECLAPQFLAHYIQF